MLKCIEMGIVLCSFMSLCYGQDIQVMRSTGQNKGVETPEMIGLEGEGNLSVRKLGPERNVWDHFKTRDGTDYFESGIPLKLSVTYQLFGHSDGQSQVSPSFDLAEKYGTGNEDSFVVQRTLESRESIQVTFSQMAKDSLSALVQKYYDINVRIFQAGSVPEDIDELFKIFTQDFVYIHPKYGGTYTRDDLYNGYIRNQKNGGYDGSTVTINVKNMIVGLNTVAVEKRFVNKEDGIIKEGESQMTLFEFREGKISRIFEYW